MRHLIIAKSLEYFWNHVEDRHQQTDIKKMYRSQGRVLLKNGDELIYIGAKNKLRGFHGVEVHMWSVPSWFDFETEQLAQHARLP